MSIQKQSDFTSVNSYGTFQDTGRNKLGFEVTLANFYKQPSGPGITTLHPLATRSIVLDLEVFGFDGVQNYSILYNQSADTSGKILGFERTDTTFIVIVELEYQDLSLMKTNQQQLQNSNTSPGPLGIISFDTTRIVHIELGNNFPQAIQHSFSQNPFLQLVGNRNPKEKGIISFFLKWLGIERKHSHTHENVRQVQPQQIFIDPIHYRQHIIRISLDPGDNGLSWYRGKIDPSITFYDDEGNRIENFLLSTFEKNFILNILGLTNTTGILINDLGSERSFDFHFSSRFVLDADIDTGTQVNHYFNTSILLNGF